MGIAICLIQFVFSLLAFFPLLPSHICVDRCLGGGVWLDLHDNLFAPKVSASSAIAIFMTATL